MEIKVFKPYPNEGDEANGTAVYVTYVTASILKFELPRSKSRKRKHDTEKCVSLLRKRNCFQVQNSKNGLSHRTLNVRDDARQLYNNHRFIKFMTLDWIVPLPLQEWL